MIAEVVVEALPQWIMQAIIFVLVSQNVRNGTASPVDMTLYNYQDGSFLSVMPKSILISSCTMLKTWYDLVQEAREAGIPVAKKAVQLWRMAADRGNATAQKNLGNAYLQGDGCSQNLEEARRWLTLASLQGHNAAKSALARLET